jgi:hypothetical protein
MHHTRSAGLIVSTFIGLAVLGNDSFSRRQTSLLLIEQISIGSLKKAAVGGNFGLPFGLRPDRVRSSSDSTEEGDDDDDDEEPREDTPKESSDSGDDNRGVALIVLEGEPVISVGGRICCILGGGMLRSSSSESHGKRLHSRAEGR